MSVALELPPLYQTAQACSAAHTSIKQHCSISSIAQPAVAAEAVTGL
jgi:hypothetical protein